jgi:hypothetical protein
MAPRDLLDGDVGLPDNYTFKVQEAEYNNDSEYNNGQTLLLILRGTRTLEDGEVQLDQREIYSCGNKWKQTQGGQFAIHETKGEPWDDSLGDKAPRFNKQSAIYSFLTALSEAGGAELLRNGTGDGKGYFNAQTFVGVEMKMKQTEVINPVSQEVKSRALPASVSGGPIAGATQTVAPAAVATAETNGHSSDVLAQLKAKAAEIKANGGDNNAFVSAVVGTIDGWDAHAVEVTDGTIFAGV